MQDVFEVAISVGTAGNRNVYVVAVEAESRELAAVKALDKSGLKSSEVSGVLVRTFRRAG